MDPSSTSPNDVEVKPEKIEAPGEEAQYFLCNLCDTEMVNKIAEEILTGLASACVDNTTGDIFKSPATVAVDLRKEMVDYLTERSESSVAESVILEGDAGIEASDNPFDIISIFIDDYVSLKRNLFGRVSGWLLSEMREDKTDDFVQEMELNSFWSFERRQAIARALLKNADFKNIYHCDMKFNTEAELSEHYLQCGFRSVDCENEGCNAKVTAARLQNHDESCPFKVLPCEQKCPEFLIRREMDKHCITVCTMKLVSCPFYSVGCQSSVLQCTVKEHCSESIHPHLLYALRYLHKKASVEDLKELAKEIEQSPDSGQLSALRDVRSLTTAVKKIEAKLVPVNTDQARKGDAKKRNEGKVVSFKDDQEHKDTQEQSPENSAENLGSFNKDRERKDTEEETAKKIVENPGDDQERRDNEEETTKNIAEKLGSFKKDQAEEETTDKTGARLGSFKNREREDIGNGSEK